MNAIPSLNPADDAETGLIAWAERGLVPDAALRRRHPSPVRAAPG